MRRDIALKYFDKSEHFMQTVVENGIERNRKGDFTLTVTDKSGEVIPNTKIKLRQINHEFKYGANIFMLEEMETAEKNEQYKKSFKKAFNIATIPFYWSDLEPEREKPRFEKDSPKIYRRPATDLCVDFCLENGIEPKCHCLNYDNFTPEWIRYETVGEHKAALEKRFRELAKRYADKIPSWEVTNETIRANEIDLRTKFYYEDDFVEWSFRMADRYFPNNRLIINEFYIFENEAYMANRSQYYMQIERLLNNGISHLDSIGLQFHSFFPKEKEKKFAATRYNPEYLYRILDLYAKFGKPLQMTEITIPAYSSDAEDEEIQAELIEKLYSVFFSHPAMEAIIYWNVVDGYAAFAPMGDMSVGENVYHGGLLRFDMSEKPAYRVIDDLFNKKWRTEIESETDDFGAVSFRGFYGEYDVKIEACGKTVTRRVRLLKNKKNNVKISL